MKRQPWFVVLGLVFGVCACVPMSVGPSERAGLGTSWGETRESRVHLIDFDRDDPDRPFAVSLLHYDDPQGVRAQARGAGPIPGAGPGSDVPGVEGRLSVRLVDESGFSLPTLWRGGLTLVQGHRGQRYAIQIRNDTRERVEAVATVDGLDVMDGERGSFATRGYILWPGQTYRIDGVRRSQEAVAAFRFGGVDDSYAARMGDDTNVGVVGVAFFAERGTAAGREDEAARRAAADPFPDRFAAPPPNGGW